MLIRIACCLVVLLTALHHPPRLCQAAPIQSGQVAYSRDVNRIYKSVEYINEEDEELREAIKAMLQSSEFANITSRELRSDRFNATHLSSARRRLQTIVWISVESWAKYLVFRQDTCRNQREELPNFGDDDFLQGGYFKWEDDTFHREIRSILFPEAVRSIAPLVEEGLVSKIDERFFRKPMESYCSDIPVFDVEEEKAKENSQFEDEILNRVFEPR